MTLQRDGFCFSSALRITKTNADNNDSEMLIQCSLIAYVLKYRIKKSLA